MRSVSSTSITPVEFITLDQALQISYSNTSMTHQLHSALFLVLCVCMCERDTKHVCELYMFKGHVFSVQWVHESILVFLWLWACMHDHVNKSTFCVRTRVIMGHVHQHTEHEASVTGRRHLMPVTGLDQVCTNENWFLWKTESNQGQFSHLPRCTNKEEEKEWRQWKREENWTESHGEGACRREMCWSFEMKRPTFTCCKNGMANTRSKAIKRRVSPLVLPLFSSHPSILERVEG